MFLEVFRPERHSKAAVAFRRPIQLYRCVGGTVNRAGYNRFVNLRYGDILCDFQ